MMLNVHDQNRLSFAGQVLPRERPTPSICRTPPSFDTTKARSNVLVSASVRWSLFQHQGLALSPASLVNQPASQIVGPNAGVIGWICSVQERGHRT